MCHTLMVVPLSLCLNSLPTTIVQSTNVFHGTSKTINKSQLTLTLGHHYSSFKTKFIIMCTWWTLIQKISNPMLLYICWSFTPSYVQPLHRFTFWWTLIFQNMRPIVIEHLVNIPSKFFNANTIYWHWL